MKRSIRLLCIGLFLLMTVSTFTACEISQDDVIAALEGINSLLEETNAELFETESVSITETEAVTEAATEQATETEAVTEAVTETESALAVEEVVAYGEYYYDVENVVLYLDTYGELPENYMTKE